MVLEISDMVPDTGKTKRQLPMQKIWMITTFVLAALLVISFVGNMTGFAVAGGGDAVGKSVEKFVNENLVSEGSKAELKNTEVKGTLIELTMEVDGQDVPVYTNSDGSLIFLRPIDTKAAVQASKPKAETPIPKTDKPNVDLYVMSFCPFGNKAEDTILPVYNLLKDKVNWAVHYIVSVSGDKVSSLHGQPEVDQNMREVCVKKNYGVDAFWKFVTYVNSKCGSDGKCWEDAAKDAGADASKIKTCVESEGAKLMKEEADAAEKAGAQGSPTMFINGAESSKVYSYGQSDTYKEAICSAFNTAPKECETKLGTSTEAATASGSCS